MSVVIVAIKIKSPYVNFKQCLNEYSNIKEYFFTEEIKNKIIEIMENIRKILNKVD